jgi:hypothetical protein
VLNVLTGSTLNNIKCLIYITKNKYNNNVIAA